MKLVTADGNVVGYNDVFVTASADGSYVPYTVEVPYQVKTPTWVLPADQREQHAYRRY